MMAPGSKLTHFLCIPLVTAASRPQLQASLLAFKSDAKNDSTPDNPSGIPEEAIRPVGTIHLTLGVMSLLSQERIDCALTVLRSLDLNLMLTKSSSHLLTGGGGCEIDAPQSPLEITLRGLNSMHHPSKTSILYTKPSDSCGSIQAFCNEVREAFRIADLLVTDTRPLLLHATILNTIYVPGVRKLGAGATGHGKFKAKMTIDARDILERYEQIVWMKDVRIEKVVICKMGAKRILNSYGDETGDEEYVVEGEIPLPWCDGKTTQD